MVLLAIACDIEAQGISPEAAVQAVPSRMQEENEKPSRLASARVIAVAVNEFQRAVSGNASVRNQCRIQSKESEIEENSEVVETDHCKLVIKTVKTTRAGGIPDVSSAKAQQSVEFMIYADLSDLTTPVLVEPQRFAQCDAGSVGVLKVSSRADPREPLPVMRSQAGKPGEGQKQTRKDLSLFFADPKAAKRAAVALDRAVRACGGKEWPDEDDLP